MAPQPNYSDYTYEELLDVVSRIDKDSYPERYNLVMQEIAERTPTETNIDERVELDKYKTIWARFVSLVIDTAVVLGGLFVLAWILLVVGLGDNWLFDVLSSMFWHAYVIFMHSLGGQTVGKMIMEIKVIDHKTGADIGFPQAFYRESVQLSFGILMLLCLYAVSGDDDISVGLVLGIVAVFFGGTVWLFANMITAFCTEKRRALHDFIGRTVVVHLT
ncbi:MAG: RDD family protein [Idiomarina sp.]|nr:RDD family protein [Idiomarina sp.]